ncbi:MAG TPA: hypothetical protein PLV68_21070, partial [Ilumatobacteraceae bacterium]|nr:hypothetical protein [Ilumatobacteraceae bacterium]
MPATAHQITRPIATMIETALATPTGSVPGDIARLRDTLAVALRRCLDRPTADWGELVAAAAGHGGWDQW